jgi:hypothetical protein
MTTFQPLTGVFEPSAIQQLADGRFLVVEDEKEHPFCLVTLGAQGVSSVALAPATSDVDGDPRAPDDLEALTMDACGRIYALTSHSRDGKGRAKPAREQLVRFRVEGDRMVDLQVIDDLKAALGARYPVLAGASVVADVKNQGGLNLEAMDFGPGDGQLWLGFRSPVLNGRAALAAIDAPMAMFEAGDPPQLNRELIELDLGGDGLRGMAWMPGLGGFLLIAGPASREPRPFRFWFWSEEAPGRPRRVTVPGLSDIARAEGVCPAKVGGRDVVVLVSDDGDRKAGRCAGYLMIEQENLRIEDRRSPRIACGMPTPGPGR